MKHWIEKLTAKTWWTLPSDPVERWRWWRQQLTVDLYVAFALAGGGVTLTLVAYRLTWISLGDMLACLLFSGSYALAAVALHSYRLYRINPWGKGLTEMVAPNKSE